mmetsp:Transcript_4057/g.13332  ORF Transcript_4057/g.13332 Transcript_4057/m.13332 type:complete len:277 (+) Transcript_4057:272-1102(+)
MLAMAASEVPLRRGKWTREEEVYVKRIIEDFNNGTLEAAPGTTLRNFLSEKLNCDPMRITKKFTGEASIGKRVFHPVESDQAALEVARKEVNELETRWRRKLEALAKEQAEGVATKRKTDDDPSTDKRRRLDSAETRRYDAWLSKARAIVDGPADKHVVSDIDALLEEGHRLRRDLGAKKPPRDDDDFPNALELQHNNNFPAKRGDGIDDRENDHHQNRTYRHDDQDDEDNEATNLLVDFLRSAQQQLASTNNGKHKNNGLAMDEALDDADADDHK